MPLTEAQPAWLPAAQAGDPAAFAELVVAHQSRVRRQLRRLTNGDMALADDLAQETFVQAWTALPGFRGQARLSTWLHRIAYSRFLMQRRSVRDEALADETQCEPSAMPGHALRIDMLRAIAALPQNQRAAIIHCYCLDLSHDEAADVLQMPLGTLKSHVARAKVQLRLALAAWQPESMR